MYYVYIYIYIQNSNNTKNNSSYVYTVLGGLCFRSHFCLLLKPQVFLVKSRKKGPPSEMAFSWCSTAHKCWWWRLPYTFLVLSLISGLWGFGIPNVATDQCAFVVSAPCAGKSQSTSCTTKKGDPRAVALLGRKFHGFVVQRSGLRWGTWSLAGRGAPGHQCSRERIRGRRGYQGQEAQFLCIAVLREGGSLINLARGRYPNRAGQIKEKEDQEVFQTLALPVFC